MSTLFMDTLILSTGFQSCITAFIPLLIGILIGATLIVFEYFYDKTYLDQKSKLFNSSISVREEGDDKNDEEISVEKLKLLSTINDLKNQNNELKNELKKLKQDE